MARMSAERAPIERGPSAAPAIDAAAIASQFRSGGYALLPRLLDGAACERLRALYPQDALFRSTIVMARHGFGRGEYRYFSYPLPQPIARLRTTLYRALAPIANAWSEALRSKVRYPQELDEFLARCHAAGQLRPTPLLLHYVAGDYNCLHQDLYGELAFPLQVTVLLSRPGAEFSGGEFVLTEQRPRRQSRAEIVPLTQGDAVIFAVSHRPVEGARGHYRATWRHGVSRVREGERYTAGIIFHDAA